MQSWQTWMKAAHIISVIAWMAGLLYLPRMFVYHAKSAKNSTESATFKIMEGRLLKAIMTPAMLAVWITGPALAYGYGEFQSTWLHAKLLLVVIMSGFHGYLARQVKMFKIDENKRSSGFYRAINEVPTALMILIVILVVVKPV